MNSASWRRGLGAVIATSFLSVGVTVRSDGRQGAAPGQPQGPPETRPAEQVFKNIQVFTGMPAGRLQGAMAFIASSLNVDCDYCHVQDFGNDGARAKIRAREMIRMVRDLNQRAFQGRDVVNCVTCHQGHTTPVSTSAIGPLVRPTAAAPTGTRAEASLPSVVQVLDRYVQALGGQAALDRVTSRIVTTARLTGASANDVMELVQKAPAKALRTQQSQGYTLWVGFNGARAWAQDSDKSYWGLLNELQRHAIIRDAEFYQGSRLRNQYGDVTVSGRDKIGEREAFVVAGTAPEGTRERFYFDVETGLLLRRSIEERTEFGWFPIQSDFEDYRAVDGVELPFVVHWASAGGAWGVRPSLRVLEVRDNVPVDDARFEAPPSGGRSGDEPESRVVNVRPPSRGGGGGK
jgi:photosynthetic reaction center cytochrome c subunit